MLFSISAISIVCFFLWIGSCSGFVRVLFGVVVAFVELIYPEINVFSNLVALIPK